MAFLASISAAVASCSLTSDLNGFAGPATRTGVGDAGDGGIPAEPRDAGEDGAVRGYRDEVLADSPIAYYRLGESVSSRPAVDEVTGRAGSYQGSVVLGRLGAIAGDANGAAELDGLSGKILIGGDLAGFGERSGFTLEAWIRPTKSDLEYRRIVANEGADGSGRQGWLFWAVGMRGGEAPRLSLERYRDDIEENAAYTQPLTLDVWTHVATTYDGSSIVIYVDGARVATRPSSFQIVPQRNLSLGAGSEDNGFWAGGLDEVALYDRVLSTERLAAHFVAGRAGR